MKIVINIPEQIYTDIKCGITNGSYDMWLAVAEGQPLSEILDNISAEIDEKISHYEHSSSSNTANGLMMAKEIIEKYKGDKE